MLCVQYFGLRALSYYLFNFSFKLKCQKSEKNFSNKNIFIARKVGFTSYYWFQENEIVIFQTGTNKKLKKYGAFIIDNEKERTKHKNIVKIILHICA